MLSSARVGTVSVFAWLALGVVLGMAPSPTPAATRTVMAEDYMATW